MSEKYQDCCCKQFISISTNKLNDFPFKVIPLESNALSHPSLPCFFALPEGFFWDGPQLHYYGPLLASMPLKQVPLMITLSLRGKKSHRVNWEFVPVQWCSSWPRTAKSSSHLVPLFFTHAQIFGDNLQGNTVPFHFQLIYNRLITHLKTATHNQPYSFDVACWRPLAPELIFHSFTPFFKHLVPLKNVWATWCYLHTLTEAFQVLLIEFSPSRPKISNLFIAQCSYQNNLKKRVGVNKSIWKNTMLTENQDWCYICPRYHVRWKHNLLIPLLPIVHTVHPVPLLFR